MTYAEYIEVMQDKETGELYDYDRIVCDFDYSDYADLYSTDE